MSSGTLEVMLIGGQNMKSGDYFSKPDPYCIINYGNQSRRSNVARKQGSTPTWNATFKFDVEYCSTDADDKHKITFRVMDEDLMTADDELGGFEIDAKRIISDGMMLGQTAWRQDSYNVLSRKAKKYGEIRVGIRFVAKDKSILEQYSERRTQVWGVSPQLGQNATWLSGLAGAEV